MPLPSDGLDVGYFDLEQGPIKDFHRVDTSYAWNYHKGCRLQWLDKNRMIYNTAIANRLVSKIHDLSTGEYQVIDCPIDAVYHDGQRSLASSFSYERLERCMPGYGYPYRDGGKSGITACRCSTQAAITGGWIPPCGRTWLTA